MSGLDVRSFTVGPVQENSYIVRLPGESRALLIDPGDEPERLIGAIERLGVQIEAILVTHCHFDHIGAVAPLARATGAPVYCPALERPVLENIALGTPPGFGPFESYTPEHTLAGGESLNLAGIDIEVLLTPGHSPGHLTYVLPAYTAILSGDVLFQGSIGRTDLPFGDHPTLERTLAMLVDTQPPETVVYPGHMGVTSLRRELETNPFLVEIRSERQVPVPRTAPAQNTSPQQATPARGAGDRLGTPGS